jgi:hypothetical protein
METHPKTIFYIFDMDDTLILSDRQFDRDHDYLVLKVFRECDAMMALFRTLRDAGERVYILTNRHPAVKPAVASYFGIPQDFVLCREFSLNMDEHRKRVAEKAGEDEFVTQGILAKITTLNTLAKQATAVFYFDDMAEVIYIHGMPLEPNLFITWPGHDLHCQAQIYDWHKRRSGEYIKRPKDRGYLGGDLGGVMEVDDISNFDFDKVKQEFNALFPAYRMDGYKGGDDLCPPNRMFLLYERRSVGTE